MNLPLRLSHRWLSLVLALAGSGLSAHDGSHGPPELDAMIAAWRAEQAAATGVTPGVAAAPPAGYGAAMAASFGAFRPRVRSYYDATTFYVESDNVPDPALMPTLMVGITSWQQQIPVPTSYFASTTNPERDQGSIGFGKPNVWRLPLVPTPSASPIPISAGNFQRGAIAVGADGIAIFNPRNNTGRVSYEIGELDLYGGHCGLADDYHYHIAPVHLQAVLGIDQPVAWALDGYPIYGYTEPDGSPRQTLDADGGHSHGAWNYHYHAIGSAATGPAAPYLPAAFHGTVINFGGQVDGQPEVQSLRQSGTGGYTAQAVAGARIVGYKNPVAFDVDAAGNLSESLTGTPSTDQFLMRVQIGNTTYDECWRINRSANPKTMTVTWRLPSIAPTTTTYNNGGNRLTAYGLATFSLKKVPDTGQTIDVPGVTGEDADYTINPPSYTDNGNGTITDNVTGLTWQKVDNGESTWENALARAAGITTGGFTDWRLPTPTELFSIMNHNNGNPAALNTAFFPSNAAGAAEYWWTSDIYGADATKVWCVNAGGGLGPKPKSETIGAGGTLRYHTRYVRGAKPSNGHNYVNHLDGTVTDLDTGLMWTQVPASARSWSAALTYAESLTLAGYTDWRLPNIKELQTLVDVTLATATTQNGAQAPVNRVLFPSATTQATAYWSSTVLRPGGNNAPTQAWLVEFGVNNSVPAANGPGRNAQGLISYEVMTSSYPVFAVRTAGLATGPVITAQPVAFQTTTLGAAVSLSVTATSDTPVTYQWRKDGIALAGATGATFALANVKSADAGSYTVVASNATGQTLSSAAVLALGTSRLANLSVRSHAGSGTDTLIMGFVVGSGAAPTLLVRGVGPTLAAFGVAGVLADPVLTVASQAGAVVATNDDWGSAGNAAQLVAAAAQSGAFALPVASHDAAVLTPLGGGAFTAQLTAKAGASGNALIEAYAQSTDASVAPLVNLSARTRAGSGSDVLIAGFVVTGTEPKR
ncbi:MAG: DUF1566 domain-containing protein, partial [Verrucomicrobia bacterium]|nr:DUF1566 domain-containing protein [Verrucomicrobiota bacterium]